MMTVIVLFRFIWSKSIVKTKTVAAKLQMLAWVHNLEFTPCACIWYLCGRLWLSGTASVLLSEGFCFSSPGLHVKVSLGKILNPELLLMFWSAPCMVATAIGVWKYLWITVSCFGQKRLLNALNVNVNVSHGFERLGLSHNNCLGQCIVYVLY